MRLSTEERETISSFLKKADSERRKNSKMRIMGSPALFRLCHREEKSLLKKFLALDPRTYDFKGVCYGIFPPPAGLFAIKKQRIRKTGKYLNAGIHYLPRKAYRAYQRMNHAMFHDIGREVFVASGYRSPAYQLVVFMETLKKYKFDVGKTAKRVALPGYSEHGAPRRQAIDFTTPSLGVHTTDSAAFARTKEYRWLKKHAHEFGFHLSYPRGNKLGVAFEPWHWHYDAMVRGKGTGSKSSGAPPHPTFSNEPFDPR